MHRLGYHSLHGHHRVGDNDLCQFRKCIQVMVANNRNGAVSHGAVHKLMSVHMRTAQANKKSIGFYFAGIGAEVGNFPFLIPSTHTILQDLY